MIRYATELMATAKRGVDRNNSLTSDGTFKHWRREHAYVPTTKAYIASVYYDIPLGYTFRSQIIDKLYFNEHCCLHTTLNLFCR